MNGMAPPLRPVAILPIKSDFWLSTSGDELGRRPSLDGDLTVDVAIMGGGYSGLWTAYHLLCGNPALEVAIVEREFCGYGASGRNGGWCSPRFPVDAGALVRRYGADIARETIVAQQSGVQAFGAILAEEGIDAHFRPTGLLSLARGDAQLDLLEDTFEILSSLGLADGNRMLDAGEAFDLVHVTGLSGAMRTGYGAKLHPGRLVRGLAHAVERRGARIFEGTAATDLRLGSDAAIVTANGTVRARRAVVAAGEAYMTGLPRFHRRLLPMSSMIVLTAPLTDAQWDAVGWAGGEGLSSQTHTKNYLTRTEDGRILYGSRGAPYHYGSRMSESALCSPDTFAWMRDTVREWWPALNDVEFTHAWGGYLGVPRDWMPTVSFDEDARLAQLHGYTGRGVSTSAMCARLVAGLIGGWKTGLEGLPFHRRDTPQWEIEPFRWAGVRYIQNALARLDASESAGRRPPRDAILAEHLSKQ